MKVNYKRHKSALQFVIKLPRMPPEDRSIREKCDLFIIYIFNLMLFMFFMEKCIPPIPHVELLLDSMDAVLRLISLFFHWTIRVLSPYKDHLSKHRYSHYKYKTVTRLSYLYHGNPFTDKRVGIFLLRQSPDRPQQMSMEWLPKWGPNKMVATLQTSFSKAFSWMKTF